VGAVLATATTYASWWVYCRGDLLRRPSGPALLSKLPSPFPPAWRAVLWLACRQGWWILGAGCAGAVFLAVLVRWMPLVIWPLGTLLLGVAFGLAAFAPDQGECHRFLGAQRLPPGRFWTAKGAFWGLALLAATGVAWLVATAAQETGAPGAGDPNFWLRQWQAW